MTARRADTERRTIALVAGVIAVVNALSLVLDPRDRAYAPLFAVDLAHGVIAFVVAILAVRVRVGWSRTRCDLAFVVIATPFLIGLWLPQTYDSAHGALLDPLLAHRFLLLGLAISAPSWRSGAAMISLFTGHAAVLEYTLKEGASLAALDREPWFTLFFAMIAGLLLYTRERRRGLEHRLAAVEERARTLAQVSRVMLALRDRANTPLQTLELAISKLELDGDHDAAVLDLMRRSLARLVEIQRTIAIDAAQAVDLGAALDLEAAIQDLLTDPRASVPILTVRPRERPSEPRIG